MVDPVKGNEISRGPSKGVTHGVGCGCDAPFFVCLEASSALTCGACFPVGIFEYRGDGCFCQVGKGFNVVVSINILIMCFLFFGRGYQ